ncbi:MAG: hypothetical protein RMX35_30405 [Nostoc sp. DcaGUA01]|nr:hypothetical protein [Nostoc sp. DcaGUA01]
MKLKQNPSYKEIALSVAASISLLGLLGLAFVDESSKQAFLQMSTFTIGAVVGYFIPGQK